MARHVTATLTTYDLCTGAVVGTQTVTDPPCPAGCSPATSGPTPFPLPPGVYLVTQVLHLGTCKLDPPVCVPAPACPLPDCPTT